MSSIHADMIASAVAFLQDGSVADSPLAKKIEFLQSKGLSDDEIQEALRQAQSGPSQAQSGPSQAQTGSGASQPIPSSPQPPVPPPADYSQQRPVYYSAPLQPERDWKDYLIMGAATAGLAYGAYQVVRHYIIPRLAPASKDELQKEKDGVDQEFMRIESLLNKFEDDQQAFYKKQDEKSLQIDETISQIDGIISKNNEKTLQNEETLKYLKLEVDNIKTTLMKSMESQKNTIAAELSALETQVQELKAELQSDGKGANFFSQSQTNLRTTPSSGSTTPGEPASRKSVSGKSVSGNPVSGNPVSGNSVSGNSVSGIQSIPSPSAIPSVNDVLDRARVPAWQSAALDAEGKASSPEKSGDRSIPAWQLNN